MIKRLHEDAGYREFMEGYRDFIAQRVAPLCGDASGLVYQCPPTIRVSMPARKPTIGLHCDSEYERHQSAEINFWVPLTRVWGSNTLHLESSPDAGDFRPVEMDFGTALRFNGNHCRHFTEANDTNCTRVSFDFRIVPRSLWRDDYDGMIGDYQAAVLEGPIVLS
jgi:ectoine hydroxylase-related dioxygenase (phytanoyl-CoA dioxygenase family)